VLVPWDRVREVSADRVTADCVATKCQDAYAADESR
jgi:hypothetical protein